MSAQKNNGVFSPAESSLSQKEYAELADLDLKLDMSRGKPNPVQLDLSMGILAQDPSELIITRKGTVKRLAASAISPAR